MANAMLTGNEFVFTGVCRVSFKSLVAIALSPVAAALAQGAAQTPVPLTPQAALGLPAAVGAGEALPLGTLLLTGGTVAMTSVAFAGGGSSDGATITTTTTTTTSTVN